MHRLEIPLNGDIIGKLKVGDEVLINGRIVTGRDTAHIWLLEQKRGELEEYLQNSLLYHCGPVVKQQGGNWSFIAAGPTTSIREEPYEADVIKNYGLRGIIGKGGMGAKTLAAFKDFGAVYFHAIGGLATSIAQSVKKVERVFMLEEFGVPEAMWVIQVLDFPAIVTMDAHGNSLHTEIRSKSDQVYSALIDRGYQ